VAEIKRAEFQKLNQTVGPCAWVPVLMYHHVLPSEEAKAILASNLNVPPEVFRSQLEYLVEKGYQVISLAQMVSMIKNHSLPPKPVVITFDDAYQNFYTHVFPLLKEKNLKATVFVITQFVGGQRYVNWGQLKEMANSSLVEIGNHTLNHPYLSKLNREETRNQILAASNILEENLGKKPEFMAYPYGNTSQTVKEVLKETGFKGALLTTYNSPQCLGQPYAFSRIRIGATSLSRYGL
jgi:peptidoglycan/xylan/chitin deacetylase (PgdA/CDA1 family)